MKVKVREASGPVLNWMVGVAEGDRVFRLRVGRPDNWVVADYDLGKDDRWVVRAQVPNVGRFADYTYNPSTDWSQGGPIIEREWLHVEPWPNSSNEEWRWSCTQYDAPTPIRALGPTPLIAAMRCFVISELGDEVEVPEELLS